MLHFCKFAERHGESFVIVIRVSPDILERERSIVGYVPGKYDGSLPVHGDVQLCEPCAEYPLHGPLQPDT